MPPKTFSFADRPYFLSGEKVCKEPLGTFRMVPRPSRRPKGDAMRLYYAGNFLLTSFGILI